MSQKTIYTIKELTNYIKSLVEKDPLLSDMWIRGEISNYTHHTSGHMYFTLKDDTSKLRSIMFAGNNRYLKFIPKNGMKIIARGYLSLYERDGQYQFYVQELQPDGIGQLYLDYEQLKEKLDKEGLFSADIKKSLPSFPKKIGVITSPTGAAIKDILATINRRYPLVQIILYPVVVQGESAPSEIAKAIAQMNRSSNVDLLIVGRGGGSIEELWAFNEEIVARSIYASEIPIISAVGHETDFTIADFVADVRAATPTAAGELAVPHIDDLKANIDYLSNRMEKQIKTKVERAKSTLNNLLKARIFRRPKQSLQEHIQRVDNLHNNLRNSLNRLSILYNNKYSQHNQRLQQQSPLNRVKLQRVRLQQLKKQLIRETELKKISSGQKLSMSLTKLDSLNPLKIMQRGYALPYEESGKKLVKTINDIQLGDILKLRLIDGSLSCQVWSMEEDQDER